MPIGSVNVGHVRLFKSGGHLTDTFQRGRMIGPCGFESVRSQQHVFGTAIEGSMSCLGARAGASTTSGFTGSTEKKGLIYEGRDLGVMSRAVGGWTGLRPTILTLAKAWILSVIASLTDAVFGR